MSPFHGFTFSFSTMVEEKIKSELFLGQGSLMCGVLAQKLKSVDNLSNMLKARQVYHNPVVSALLSLGSWWR